MKQSISLCGTNWQFARSRVGEAAPYWDAALPARVPGNIVDALSRAGLLPDPFYAENFRACKWTEEIPFWYRIDAEVPGDWPDEGRLVLACDGIDTFGEVFVDGISLGTTHNMHRRHRFDLPATVRPGARIAIVVRIAPPDLAARKWARSIGIDPEQCERPVFGYHERVYSRKAQMSYGWDQTPCLLTGGIFRDVRLECFSGPVIEEMSWNVEDLDLAARRATVVFEGKTSGAEGLPVSVRAAGEGCGFSGAGQVAGGMFQVRCEVDDARFWWPNGHGDPHLYAVTLTLGTGVGGSGDVATWTVGIRTVRVVTEPAETILATYRIGKPEDRPAELDGGGLAHWQRVPLDVPEEVERRPFRFEVNGRPVFIKGFNWMNPHALLGCAGEDVVRGQVRLARETHANMLRLNGVATPEIDAFYDECSRCGMLIWQDFYFASALYPQVPGFLDEVRVEAEDLVRRVRNHTSVALWCGDNEADMNLFDRKLDPESYRLNREVIPGAIAGFDPQRRFYHVSCPSGGPYPRSDWGGDKRNWGGWFPANNYRHIRQESATFVSEGGSYTLPPLRSIEKFLPPSLQWPLDSSTWILHHGGLDREDRKLWESTLASMRAHAGFTTIEEAVRVSQFAHAWGSKLLVERCRQRNPDCGGVLLWKFNAVWPCADGQYIDFFGEKMLGYDYVREAMKPVAVSLTQPFDRPESDVEVFVCNDLPRAIVGTLDLAVLAADPSATERLALSRIEFQIAAGESLRVASCPIGGLDPATAGFAARITTGDKPGMEAFGLFTLLPSASYLLMEREGFRMESLARWFETRIRE